MNNSLRVVHPAQAPVKQFRLKMLQRVVLPYAKWVASVLPVWCVMNMANVFHRNCVSALIGKRFYSRYELIHDLLCIVFVHKVVNVAPIRYSITARHRHAQREPVLIAVPLAQF